MIHIYTGDGKGKTTSAIGLAIRAYGWGKRVCFIQFMKRGDFPSGERNFLSGLGEGFKFIRFDQEHPMFWRVKRPAEGGPYSKSVQERLDGLKESIRQSFRKTARLIESGQYDLIVLDEVINAVSGGFIEEERLIELLNLKPDNLELVLTGRVKNLKRLKDLAHYITYMKAVKHPYDSLNIPARKGVEY